MDSSMKRAYFQPPLKNFKAIKSQHLSSLPSGSRDDLFGSVPAIDSRYWIIIVSWWYFSAHSSLKSAGKYRRESVDSEDKHKDKNNGSRHVQKNSDPRYGRAEKVQRRIGDERMLWWPFRNTLCQQPVTDALSLLVIDNRNSFSVASHLDLNTPCLVHQTSMVVLKRR